LPSCFLTASEHTVSIFITSLQTFGELHELRKVPSSGRMSGGLFQFFS